MSPRISFISCIHSGMVSERLSSWRATVLLLKVSNWFLHCQKWCPCPRKQEVVHLLMGRLCSDYYNHQSVNDTTEKEDKVYLHLEELRRLISPLSYWEESALQENMSKLSVVHWVYKMHHALFSRPSCRGISTHIRTPKVIDYLTFVANNDIHVRDTAKLFFGALAECLAIY